MESRQNDEILKNPRQPEREIIVSQGKKPWKERFEKLPKIRKILLITVLALSALPFLMTDLKAENDGVGSVVFISSIVLLIPAGIGFIITLIQTIWIRKKLRTDSVASGSNTVEILVLPGFAAAYGLTALIAEGRYSVLYGSVMMEVYFIIGFAVLLLDLLVDNWKGVLKTKTVQLALLAFLPQLVLSAFMGISILPVLSVSALLVAAASVLLYKKPDKFTDCLFTKKQFKACFSATTAVFVLFCALSIISPVVTDKRIDDHRTKLTEALKDKIFITDRTDRVTRGYVFDAEGHYCSVYENGNQSSLYNITVQIDWFGFGAAHTNSFDAVTYEEQGNAVALVENHYDGSKIVYKLSDSIPCFKHEFGEYVTLEEAKSCQEPGTRKRTCEKCGYEETSTVTAPHAYVNGKCKVCGEKEPVEYSNIEADTWYVYKPIPQLKFQNCEISLVTPQGGGARLMLTYYPVCSHCHARGEYQLTAVSDEKTDFYYCPECDGHTAIVFAIVS